MRQYIDSTLLKILSARMAHQADVVELMPKYRLKKYGKLTAEEISQIDTVWKKFSRSINYRYWMVYKGMSPFTPMLVPDDIYVRDILRVLNPMRKCYCLQNKNMYPILYRDLQKPVTLINCIDGNILDLENSVVSPQDIVHSIKKNTNYGKVILKPSADSCSGNGVAVLNIDDEDSCFSAIKAVGSNYVIQEILPQSEITKRFNPSSLNTFRVNTLNLNGNVTVENIMFRHGRGDSIVDNAGAGGVCVGFNPDGKVIGKAIDANLNEYEQTQFGMRYTDVCIPELRIISDIAIKAHREYLPMMGHAAWDFALSESNEPVFIEVNLGWPGIMTEQLSSCRPIFGSRTEEVLEYAINNKQKMSFTDFIGHWT